MTRATPQMDTYISISCSIPADLEDPLPELLAPLGVLGTEIGESSERGVCVTIYLRGDNDSGAEILSRVLVDQGAENIKLELLEAEDWLAGYREAVRPFEVGDGWWIDPHPDRPAAAPAGRRRLVIEPRMAFGTGTHESTRALLMALEEIEVSGRRVLDVGTGSGILAFAAESLGAASVIGLDIDQTAVWVAFETARQQEWLSGVHFVLGPVECLRGAEFDIVLCNMISSNFLPLAMDLRQALGPTGVVLFSGLLVSEVASVSVSLKSADLAVVSSRVLGDWASVTATAASLP